MLRQFFAGYRTGFSVGLTMAFMLCSLGLPSLSRSASASSAAAARQDQQTFIPVIAPGSAYRQTNLISDAPGVGFILDPLLVNPWGISSTASSPFWVVNNGTSTTQLIRGDVGGAPVTLNPSPQTVTIPGGLPTGTVAK